MEALISNQNVEVVRRMLGAFSQRDVRAIAEFLDPAIEVRSPAHAPEPGSFKGIDAVLDRLAMLIEPWEDFRFEIEELIDLGDERLVVVGRVKGRGGASGADVQMQLVHVVQMLDGRVLEIRTFLDKADALRAVGLEG
jgi:ketosteroid isomerase-like protein